MEAKEVLTFSLDKSVIDFIETAHWDYKVSRSLFVNEILKDIINDKPRLDRIFEVLKTEQLTPKIEKIDLFEL